MVNYNQQLRTALLGRRYHASTRSALISFMGEALGFPESDVHATRFYRIFLTLDDAGIITEVRTVVDGELISPCSGYFPEVLDEFDFEPVKARCLSLTQQ